MWPFFYSVHLGCSAWTLSRWSHWVLLCSWLWSTFSSSRWRWSLPCPWKSRLQAPCSLRNGLLMSAVGKRFPFPASLRKLQLSLQLLPKRKEVFFFLPFHICEMHIVLQTQHSTEESNCSFSPSDLVIRPLPAPKEPEHKSTFVLGEDETQEIVEVSETVISVPAEPRPVEDCLSILKNPNVRALSSIPFYIDTVVLYLA